MTMRPTKWILYSPLAILPFLPAVFHNTGNLLNGLRQQTESALAGAGADWAKLTLDGRDALLQGDAPSDEALDAAVKAVAGTYGVRRVDSAVRVVPPPPKVELIAPTVNAVSAEAGQLQIGGTWHEGVATSLKAALGSTAWVLGEGAALTSDGKGNWSLKPDVALAPGSYDLMVETADAAGTIQRDATVNEITVLPPPPPLPDMAPPTVESLETNLVKPVIKGTWPSAVANALTVIVGQARHVLGTGTALQATGDNWTLTLPDALPDGAVDVVAEVADANGRVVTSAVPGKLIIDTVAPAAPVVGPITLDGGSVSATGTWAEGDAVSLVAKLAGKVWSFGKDAALASDGKGNWSFKPDVKLDPGTYDVEIEITDRAGNIARDSTTDEIVVAEPAPPPPQMSAPTVITAIETLARPVIKGTWSEIAAKSLSVSLGGAKYVLGSDEGLTSDGIGNWSLAVPAPLKDGVYDVAVESADAAGAVATDASKDEITIDAAGPATPTVKPFASLESPSAITGTWDDANATSLKVSVPAANLAAVLGSDATLTTAAGHWSLALTAKLAPGSYDVVAETIDARGRAATDQTRFEVLVKEPVAPEPPPPPPPPPALKLPSINAYAGEGVPTAIGGTWDEGTATTLKVVIPQASLSASLGSDPALTSDGKGNWSFTLPQTLAPGLYDVTVETSDGASRTASETMAGAIDIKAPPPPPPPPELKAPTATIYSGEGVPAAITGTWDEVNAKTLKVAIPQAAISAVLGRDAALTADGAGNWSLALPETLPTGLYDVAVETTDGADRRAAQTFIGAIEIKAPPPPPPPPYDCKGVLAKIGDTFPILFDFDQTNLQSPYDLSVNQVAALLNDPRCTSLNAVIEGHADYFGGRLYNTALSMARAEVVLQALVSAGVASKRLRIAGKGEFLPLDPQRTRDARVKNRRVTITFAE